MERKFDHGWGRLPRLQARYQAQLKLGQYESQVLRGIEYYLTGRSKRDDTISLKQLADITKIDRRNISGIVNRLVKKKAIEVKDNRYRMIFYDEVGGISTDAPFEVGGIWSGLSYIHTDDKYHPHKAKGHPQGCSPKTLSKDSLRLSPKKKEIFSKLSEEEMEKSKKRALDIVNELKKKYGEV